MFLKVRPRHLAVVMLLAALPFCQTTFANPILCESSTSDSDGDGWGWENNKSCKVAVSTSSPTSGSTQAISCASNSSDSDGDGWGWENNQSCQVVAVSSNAGSPPSSNNTQSNVTFCDSASSDPDGDGWGWENNTSCKVTETSTTEPPAAEQGPTPAPVPNEQIPAPAPTPDPTPTFSSKVKIMAVGDSITHGVSTEKTTSYRLPLSNLLNNADCRFEYVGSQRTNYNHSTFVSPHEAYYGHTADHFLTGFNDRAGNNRGIAHSMATYNPDVVLLHIGSNDAGRGQNTADIIAEIDQIVAAILDQNASAQVLVANIIPWYRTEQQSQVRKLGSAIESYVTQLSNPAITLVDVWSGYQPGYMVSDKIHPNAAGDNHIARAFFASYQNAGLCSR